MKYTINTNGIEESMYEDITFEKLLINNFEKITSFRITGGDMFEEIKGVNKEGKDITITGYLFEPENLEEFLLNHFNFKYLAEYNLKNHHDETDKIYTNDISHIDKNEYCIKTLY